LRVVLHRSRAPRLFARSLARAVGHAACVLLLLASPTAAQAETLRDSLAAAYRQNPRLEAERARLRATDEDVARAMSGFRPVVTGNADVGVRNTKTSPQLNGDSTLYPKGYSINLTQPIFSGLSTVNAVNEQEASVRAGREVLREVEQNVLLEAVTAHANVVRDQAIVHVNENNLAVLTKELRATEERFAVGELTQTDVSQAQARRASALSSLEGARANLLASRADYQRVTGNAPRQLRDPIGFDHLLPNSLEHAIQASESASPPVLAALFREQAARFAVDRTRGELLPQLELEASYSDRYGVSEGLDRLQEGLVAGRLRVPLYEGGEVHARVRQAKHVHVSLLQEIESARRQSEAGMIAAWSQLQAARAQTTSDQIEVQANAIALQGVRAEERVGERTLLDVLNAEFELLQAEVKAATTRRNLAVAKHTVLAAAGQLDAVTLALTDTAYDPEVHYEGVRLKPWSVTITHGE
jgi:outer membrane protein